MRISSRVGYAVTVLAELDSAGNGLPVRTDDLAARSAVPRAYLELILAALRRARILRAVRGPGGGWKLARPASKISAMDVFNALEGPLVIIELEARSSRSERLWATLGGVIEHALSSVTIGALNRPVRRPAASRKKCKKKAAKTGTRKKKTVKPGRRIVKVARSAGKSRRAA